MFRELMGKAEVPQAGRESELKINQDKVFYEIGEMFADFIGQSSAFADRAGGSAIPAEDVSEFLSQLNIEWRKRVLNTVGIDTRGAIKRLKASGQI